MADQVAVELMQTPTGSLHVLSLARIIKCEELAAKFFCMFRLNAGFGSCAKEQLNAAVPKALYHV